MRITCLLSLLAACADPGEPGRLVPKTVDDDPSLPAIQIADTKLHAEALGDPNAPMIVVLHGGPGGDYRYLLPMAALADDGYRVVFWDQRGSGLSRRHDGSSFKQDIYRDDLRLVIDHYTTSPTQPVIFLGQSWGAMYATMFINTYGDYSGRVKGAILTEPGAFTSEGLETYMAKLIPPWGFTSEELNDLVWTDQVMSASDHERADYLQRVATLPGAPSEHNDPDNPEPGWRSGAVVNARLLDLGLSEGFDWTTNLGEFENPVLFLRGDLNENMPLEHQQELASHYANASMITVTGVGHAGIWERSDDYLAHIRGFLAGLKVTP
jgi:proline iminopeptidase